LEVIDVPRSARIANCCFKMLWPAIVSAMRAAARSPVSVAATVQPTT
jgi:hypothetical protein